MDNIKKITKEQWFGKVSEVIKTDEVKHHIKCGMGVSYCTGITCDKCPFESECEDVIDILGIAFPSRYFFERMTMEKNIELIKSL